MPPLGTCIRCGMFRMKPGRKICEACIRETAANIVDVGPDHGPRILPDSDVIAGRRRIEAYEERQRKLEEDLARTEALARGILEKLGGA